MAQKKKYGIYTNSDVCRSLLVMQGKYWILTIPQHAYLPYLPPCCCYIAGQLERGGISGYLHWQILSVFKKKTRLAGVKSCFGDVAHAELSRSEAARAYCQKEDTAVAGTRFELGNYPFRRNEKTDWEKVKKLAMENRLLEIDGDVFVRYYSGLKRIAKDYMASVDDLDDVCGVWLYGPPGVGKSRKVRQEYNPLYSKMCNKWWDGYRGEDYVLLDDFDKCHCVLGYHLKIWADRYSFVAEQKGGAVRIRPKKIVITSNYRIDEIFDDEMLIIALNRRFEIINKAI